MRLLVYCFLCFLLVAHTVDGQQSFSEKRDSFLRIKSLVFPVAYYTPETNLALGASGLKLFNKLKEDSIRFTSYLNASAVITLREQFRFESNLILYSKGNKWNWITNFEYYYFPYNYYGLYNYRLVRTFEDVSLKRFTLNNKLYRLLGENTFIGLENQFKSVWGFEYVENGMFYYEIAKNFDQASSLGLGGMFRFDSRDNNLIPREGIYFNVEYLHYMNHYISNEGNSLTSFYNIFFDFRSYFKINDKVVNAFQFYADLNEGDVPFYKMASIGNSRRMRGYYFGMMLDENLIMIQDEIRFPIYKRLQGAAFAGIGTMHSVLHLGKIFFFPNAGGGLRYIADYDRGLCIRADIGFGKKSTRGFYLTVSDAF